MGEPAATVSSIFSSAALEAGQKLLDREVAMFGDCAVHFQRRVDAINLIVAHKVSPEELAGAELVALGMALPASNDKPAVLAHGVKTLGQLSKVQALARNDVVAEQQTRDFGTSGVKAVLPVNAGVIGSESETASATSAPRLAIRAPGKPEKPEGETKAA